MVYLTFPPFFFEKMSFIMVLPSVEHFFENRLVKKRSDLRLWREIIIEKFNNTLKIRQNQKFQLGTSVLCDVLMEDPQLRKRGGLTQYNLCTGEDREKYFCMEIITIAIF